MHKAGGACGCHVGALRAAMLKPRLLRHSAVCDLLCPAHPSRHRFPPAARLLTTSFRARCLPTSTVRGRVWYRCD